MTQIALPPWASEVRAAPARSKRELRVFASHEIGIDPATESFEYLRQRYIRANPKVVNGLQQANGNCSGHLPSQTFDALSDVSPKVWADVCAGQKREFQDADRLTEIAAGKVTYHLRQPLCSEVEPQQTRTWTFSVLPLSPRFVGVGDSINDARRNFMNSIHFAFQSLVRLRPFQMSPGQQTDWELLQRVIDVDAYWASVPLVLFENGVVSKASTDGWEVAWLDGDRQELISVDQAPTDFVALEAGNWFEALVERDAITHEIQQIRHVRGTQPPATMTPDEIRIWLQSLPTAESLPRSPTTLAGL